MKHILTLLNQEYAQINARYATKNSYKNPSRASKVYFEKLHAPTEFLFERAARMNLKMPLCETWQKDIATYQQEIKKQEEQKAKS